MIGIVMIVIIAYSCKPKQSYPILIMPDETTYTVERMTDYKRPYTVDVSIDNIVTLTYDSCSFKLVHSINGIVCEEDRPAYCFKKSGKGRSS